MGVFVLKEIDEGAENELEVYGGCDDGEKSYEWGKIFSKTTFYWDRAAINGQSSYRILTGIFMFAYSLLVNKCDIIVYKRLSVSSYTNGVSTFRYIKQLQIFCRIIKEVTLSKNR